MSEIELKARPFCGGKAKRDDRTELQEFSAVDAAHSGMGQSAGTIAHTTREIKCGCGIRFAGGFRTSELWNTRASQWLPIESAPKDGTVVLATSAHMTGPNGEPVAWAAVFHQERKRWIATWDGEPLNDATHWQPLPAPLEVS